MYLTRPSMAIFLWFCIPFKNHRFRYSILYEIEHFLTQALQDYISSIWPSLQCRMVRGLVAWAFFKVEGFEVWARVFDSKSKGLRFCRLAVFLKSKGSMFGRVYSIQGRRVRGLVACWVFQIEGFEVWAFVCDSKSKGSKFGRFGFLISKGSRFGRLVAKSSIS